MRTIQQKYIIKGTWAGLKKKKQLKLNMLAKFF